MMSVFTAMTAMATVAASVGVIVAMSVMAMPSLAVTVTVCTAMLMAVLAACCRAPARVV